MLHAGEDDGGVSDEFRVDVLRLLGDTGLGTIKALSQLRSLLRRDWAVRVLDAYLAKGGRVDFACIDGKWDLELYGTGGEFTSAYTEPTPGAARHAAAQAVFPVLPADVQAELGECP